MNGSAECDTQKGKKKLSRKESHISHHVVNDVLIDNAITSNVHDSIMYSISSHQFFSASSFYRIFLAMHTVCMRIC